MSSEYLFQASYLQYQSSQVLLGCYDHGAVLHVLLTECLNKHVQHKLDR